jgi:hypothetical protein
MVPTWESISLALLASDFLPQFLDAALGQGRRPALAVLPAVDGGDRDAEPCGELLLRQTQRGAKRLRCSLRGFMGHSSIHPLTIPELQSILQSK